MREGNKEKRARGEGTEPKFNERLGRWEQRFGYRDQKSDKQKVKAVYGESRQSVVAKSKEWQRQQETGIDVSRSKMTYSEWFETWLETYKKDHTEITTYQTYRRHSDKHIIPELGDLKLKEITRQRIQEFINGKHASLSAAMLRLLRAIISDSLKVATEEDIIVKNPATGVKIPKDKVAEVEDIKPYTREELSAILKQAQKTPAIATIIELGAHTGMRRGELCGLRWQDIDFRKRVIHVKQQLKNVRAEEDKKTGNKTPSYIKPGPLKTKNAYRDIPIDDQLITLLKGRKAAQAKDKLAVGEAYIQSDMVFTNEIGEMFNPNTLSKQFARIAERAKVSQTNIHNLRHSFASVAISAGVNIKAISKTLGHATIEETLDTYGHLLPDDSMAVTAAVSAYYEGAALL